MKNYSYVTLLTDDTYTYGICLLVASMKKVNTKYPLFVLITEDVSEPCIEILNQLKVKYKKVDKIPITNHIYKHNEILNAPLAAVWKNCWTKFHIYDLTEFDKIVFFDADVMILQNMDHLFNKPHMTAALDGEYWNIWPGQDHFNAGGIVIEPSHKLFLDILNFANTFPEEEVEKIDQVVADQEILNLYFKDWPEHKELHLDKYYNIFAPYCQEEEMPDLKQNTKFVHYVGRKPWKQFPKHPSETYSEYFYEQAGSLVQDIVLTLDWTPIVNKNVLTVYAICKNEIKVIDRWLNSFELADYVCVLDTGSTDGTWEYLREQQKKRKNLIIKQQEITPWRYDVARNESMKIIPKETTMFFMADIDEIVEPKGVWPINIKNKWTPTFTRGSYTYQRDVDKDGNVTKSMLEYRVHSRKWQRWINVVHEALVNEYGDKYFFDFDCTPMDIVVWHLTNHRDFHHHNYSELCENELREHPNNEVMHLQAAIEYEIEENPKKAYEHFMHLINLETTQLQNFELARCFFGIGHIVMNQGQHETALHYFREGRLIAPYCAESYFMAAQIYINHNKIDQALDLYHAMLKNCTESFWCSVYDAYTWSTFYVMSQCYASQQNWDKALAYLMLAEEYCAKPDNEFINFKQGLINEKRKSLSLVI